MASAGTIAVFLCIGCTDMKYTVHIDNSLENAKIPPSTIAVFPIDELNFQPPSGCLSPSSAPGDQVANQAKWNEKMRTSLAAKFPNQKFVFLAKDEGPLAPGGVDFYSVKERSQRATRAMLINAMKPDSIMYQRNIVDPPMMDNLKKLSETTQARYAVVFITPSLSGSTTYQYNAYGGSSAVQPTNTTSLSAYGGSSSSTNYVADIKVLVWECATGRLLFSSGGWHSGSSSCFIFPPENMAIDGANSQFQDNLQKIITHVINYNASIRFANASR